MPGEIDLEAYFDRIGYEGPHEPDLPTLRNLHLLHPIAIPFENLTTLMGKPVRLDRDSVQRKLIHERRGGYCFEHNRLFCDVLQTIGFDVVSLAARVVWNRTDETPGSRSHMVLLVKIGTETYLSDVGFGGLTLTGPLLFEPDVEQATPHEVFRIRETSQAAEYELQARIGDAWQALYRFDLQPQLPIDYEVLNHYVATHVDSLFLTTLMAARATTEGRYALLNDEFTARLSRGNDERRRVTTVGELRETLTDIFEINLPDDAELQSALSRLLRSL